MSERIRSVFIGNFSKSEQQRVFSLKNYARFYNELAKNAGFENVSVFGGYIVQGETGFEFAFEEPLSNRIYLTLSKGNTPSTPLFLFIWNNLKLFIRLT